MTTYSWLNAANGDWNTGADWNPTGPANAATADAVITVGGSYTVTIASGESFLVDSLTFSPGSSGTLALNGTLTLGGTLAEMTGSSGTVDLAGTIAGGTVTLNGAVFDDTGGVITGAVALDSGTLEIASGKTLALSGAVTWSGADVAGPGTLATTGTTTMSSNSAIDGGLTWTNGGTVRDSSTFFIDENESSSTLANTIVNQAAGTFDFAADGFTAFLNEFTSAPTNFNNAGLLEKTAGTSTVTFGATLDNTGTMSVTSGTFDLNDGGTLDGNIAASGSGALELGGGSFTLDGTIGATGTAEIEFNGGTSTLGGTTQTVTGTVVINNGSVAIATGKTLTLSGSVAWSGGDVAGPGTLTTTGTTTISSTSFIDGGLTWTNSGMVLDGDTFFIDENQSSSTLANAIVNQAAGTFDFTADGFNAFLNEFTSAPTNFGNAGLLEKTAGTSTVTFDATLDNTGSLSVTTGTLNLNEGGTLAGNVGASGSGALELNGGTFTLGGTIGATGTAEIAFDAGTFSLAGATQVVAGKVVLNNGSVEIASGKTLTLTGAATWSGGDVVGPGTLATTGNTTISSTSYIDGGLTWTNSGTVLDGDTFFIDENLNSSTLANTIANQAAGVFDFTSDGFNAFLNEFTSAPTNFNNTGLLEKTAGTGTVSFGAALDNTGTVSVTSGTLDLNNGGTLSGTIGASGTGALELNGGTFSLAGTLGATGLGIQFDAGVYTLAGSTQLVNGPVALNGGSVEIASARTLTLSGAAAWGGADVVGPGTLTTSGTTTISSTSNIDGGLTWTNGGTVLDGAGIFIDQNMSSSTLANTIANQAGGTFDFTSDGFNAFANESASAPTNFNNAGLLEKTAGTGTLTFTATLDNTGTVSVTSGTLALNNGGTLSGTIGASGTGALELNGGAFVLAGTIGATGLGIQFDAGTFTLAGATQLVTGPVALNGGSMELASGNVLTLSGAVAWSGSDVLGPGTLTTSGTTTIGSSSFVDAGLIWNNKGTVQDGAAISFDFLTNSTLVNTIANQAGGVFDLTTDTAPFSVFGNTAAFSNAGVLAKTGGTATSSIRIPVTNTGTITASKATLELDTNSTLNGAIGGTGSGVVQLGNSAIFTTTGTASIVDAGGNTDLRIVSGATWTDSGVIDDGGLFQIGNGSGTSAFAIAAGATLDFTSADAGIVNGGGGKLTNAGLIAKTAGTGKSAIGIGFVNTGTVDVASGTLKLFDAVGGSGRLQIEAGKTLELASGTVAGSNTIDIDGLGGTLKIDTNSTVTKPIIGLGAGSRIDLAAAASVAAVISGNTLTITPSGGSALKFVSSGSLANLHLTKGSDGGTGTVVTLYNVAAASAHTPEPVAFNNVHVGAVETQTLSVKNTAPANIYTENLDGTLNTGAAGFSATGSFTGLAGGATNSSALVVTLNTASTGVKNGIATLTLASDGTGVDGLGTSALPTQTVDVTGAVYAIAAPVLSSNTINLGAVRVGAGTLTGGITLGDGSSVNAFQESLIYQFGTALPAGLTVSNAAGTLTSGQTVAVGATLSTAASGDFTATAVGAGAAGVTFTSTGAGTSGLANTPLAAPTLTVNGKVFATATANVSGSTVHFGVVHTGDVVNLVTLGVTNTVTGALTDLLSSGTVSETGSYTGSVTESLGSGLAAGAGGTVTFGLATTSTGVQSGTEELGFLSTDTALAPLALLDEPVTVTGTVDNYATATIKVLSGPTITGPGTAEVINLGTVQQGSGTLAVTLEVQNSATALADTLAGTIVVNAASGFTNTGFANFSGLLAGAATGSDGVSLTTVNAGTFTETVTLDPSSNNASFDTPLAPQTLTIKGLITPVYTLSPAPTTIVATQNLDTFIAAAGVLNSHDNLTGGPGGGNTLDLTGGGVFDLGAPATLTGIQLVNASEGQASFVNGGTTIASTAQIVFLRNGLNVTLDVGAGAPNGANPNPEVITIYGAADSSVIKLGTGTDTVVLGSATETVNGGGGTALVQATIAFAHAPVKGTAVGKTTLEITNGGTATLSAATTHATVLLDAASVLTLDTMGFVTAVGVTAGTTITAAAANQTLESLAGGDKLVGFSGFGDLFSGLSAGLSGDTIGNFGGSEKIDLTDMAPTGTPGYNGNTSQGVLTLSDGTHHVSITMLGNFVQTGFHVATDGHSGSFVTYT